MLYRTLLSFFLFIYLFLFCLSFSSCFFILCCLLVFIRFQFYLSFALLLGPSIKYVRSKGEGGGQAKTYVYCFYDVILLFKSVQVGRGCLKINRFDRTYFMDGPLRPSRITYQHNTLFLNSVNLWITLSIHFLSYFIINNVMLFDIVVKFKTCIMSTILELIVFASALIWLLL